MIRRRHDHPNEYELTNPSVLLLYLYFQNQGGPLWISFIQTLVSNVRHTHTDTRHTLSSFDKPQNDLPILLHLVQGCVCDDIVFTTFGKVAFTPANIIFLCLPII